MQLSRFGLLILRSNSSINSTRLSLAVLNNNSTIHTKNACNQQKNIFNYKANSYSTGGEPKKNLKFSTRNFQQKADTSTKNAVWYILSGFVIMAGASYAAVPLFKIFCESQGIDTSTEFRDLGIEKLKDKLKAMKKVEDRSVAVKFIASTSSDLQWTFSPCQDEIVVAPGETALAFFKAKNLTDRSIVGIATYSILPFEAGLYFNKIQCFCFEEQRLDPNEEIDMPVFFYIDEQYTNDPKLVEIDEICLSYTFFESKGSESIQNIPKLATPFPSI